MRISKQISDSIELKFSKIAKEMNKKGKIYYSLGLGEPHFGTPKNIIQSSFKAMKDGKTKYSNPAGILKLRKEVSKKLLRENKILSKPDEIVITSGSKMALTLTLMSLIQPNDEIIYFSPSYPSYLPQILLSESNVVIKRLNVDKFNYNLDFKNLIKSINKKTKVILINFPNNPLGKILKKKDLIVLEKILIKYKNCYLVSDEIYEKLNFNKIKSISPASIDTIRERVITINGFSKAYAMTGWRIGYCHANKKVIKKILKIQQHINTNVPIFIQEAALTAYKDKSDHLKSFHKVLKKNNDNFIKIFQNNKKISFKKTDGGMFIFFRIQNKNLNSDNFCTKLLQEYSVALTPGSYFGKDWKQYVRISLASNPKIFKQAIILLESFINQN